MLCRPKLALTGVGQPGGRARAGVQLLLLVPLPLRASRKETCPYFHQGALLRARACAQQRGLDALLPPLAAWADGLPPTAADTFAQVQVTGLGIRIRVRV